MSDIPISTLYRGCKNCPNAPQTFEEYCLSKCCPAKICPDAYTEVAYHCGNYEHTATEEQELNKLGLTPRYEGHWINIDATHSKCDRCGAVFEIVSENDEVNYCPNCGADMRGDE